MVSTATAPASQGKLTDPEGVTGQLCNWVESLSLNDVPAESKTRAKYLFLDGLTCALTGAHLPWSVTATNAVLEMESPGPCTVIGWDKKVGPLAAALLNSTYVQGFEIDDWHSDAPLHSNSLHIPALFAAAEQAQAKNLKSVSGADLLLATIVGYEAGPRVGLALWGPHILTRGWHSGSVFGGPAVAAAVSKLLGLPAYQMEDALGIACTQAGGLMSAQFGSDAKRMQHGFAARNGLFGAYMAKGNYIGIKKVFEEPYGGFLTSFSQGNGKTPQYRVEEISKALGSVWQLHGIRVKPWAAMAGTHCTIECVAALQKQHAEQLKDIKSIKKIYVEMSEPAYKHGGWTTSRPLTATGAQMSCAYVAAVQLIDGKVTPGEFRHDLLDRDVLWELVDKTECAQSEDCKDYAQRVTITFNDGEESKIETRLNAPKAVEPGLTNEEVLEKWRIITDDVIETGRRDRIEKIILDLENATAAQIEELMKLLGGTTPNPIA